MDKKISRRTFLKLGLGGGLLATTAGFGLARHYGIFNTPPKADFDIEITKPYPRTAKYINPNSEEEILFTNKSFDADNEDTFLNDIKRLLGYEVPQDLKYSWYVDDRIEASSKHYSTKLQSSTPGTEHRIKLKVSDGKKEDFEEDVIGVDPDELPEYPVRKLGTPIKGINYYIGFQSWWQDPVFEEEMNESLEVIKNELNCNALRIHGDYEKTLINCAEKAIDKKFDVILLSPRYLKMPSRKDVNITQHVEKIIDFSKKAEILRQSSNSTNVVLVVGNELTIDTVGIYDGLTYIDRANQISQNWGKIEYHEKLNFYLKKIVENARKNFNGKITYTRGSWEQIKWDELDFDIVASNEFRSCNDSDQSYIDKIKKLMLYDKPVYITEFGCVTYEGVCGSGGEWLEAEGKKYSQESQAECIKMYLETFNKIRIDGCFLSDFFHKVRDSKASPSIIEDGKRKKAFYLYKSYLL